MIIHGWQDDHPIWMVQGGVKGRLEFFQKNIKIGGHGQSLDDHGQSDNHASQ